MFDSFKNASLMVSFVIHFHLRIAHDYRKKRKHIDLPSRKKLKNTQYALLSAFS